jgi:hypothetical protein
MPLLPTQRAFVTSAQPFPAFVGGYGSGKTGAGIARALALKGAFKDNDIAYYLPTYPLVEDIAFARFPEILDARGVTYKVNKQHSFIEFANAGKIQFRTMENPDRIVGYEVAHSILDELDTLPTDKARKVWNRVIARNRQKCPMRNTVAVTTTPEGFKFVYERWSKNPANGYVMFNASTYENEINLPADYIQNLKDSYPDNLLQAYLHGQFVNLTSGSVYHEFSRKLNTTNEVITNDDYDIYVGMDFNVEKMACAFGIVRGENLIIADEISDGFDTPAVIKIIKERYPGKRIFVYPDASGANRDSGNASTSDLALLRQAGFTVLANHSNPFVKDRVLAVNQLIHNQGIRRLFINISKCPMLTESIEKQSYSKSGAPDKTQGFDHMTDAIGYLICYKYPIISKLIMRSTLTGV